MQNNITCKDYYQNKLFPWINADFSVFKFVFLTWSTSYHELSPFIHHNGNQHIMTQFQVNTFSLDFQMVVNVAGLDYKFIYIVLHGGTQ